MKLIKEIAVSRIEYTDESPEMVKVVDTYIHEQLSVREDGYQYSPAYKRGVWDGRTPFYDQKGKTFATGHYHLVDTCIKELQVYNPTLVVEYVDNYPEAWITEEELPDKFVLPDDKLGEITLRDYQQESVTSALLAQSGIVHVATNGG